MGNFQNLTMSDNLSLGFWNVDDIIKRVDNEPISKLTFESFSNLLFRHDILCLVETKCGPEDTLNIPGYEVVMNCRKKTPRAPKHFGGIAFAVKSHLKDGVEIFRNFGSTEIMWAKFDKNYFNLERDMYVGTVYVSPVSGAFCKTSDNIIEILEGDVAKYKPKGDIFICGDINARTGELVDFIVMDENFEDLGLNLGDNLTFRKRRNMDVELPAASNHGPALLEFCKATGVQIMNGRTFGDFEGNVTCYSHGGAKPSLIDYILTDNHSIIKMMYVNNLIAQHSPHCMLSVIFHIKKPGGGINRAPVPTVPCEKFRWGEGDSVKFTETITSPEFTAKMHVLNQEDLETEELANRVTKLIIEVAEGCELRRVGGKRKCSKSTRKTPKKKWFDAECAEMRRKFKCLGRRLRSDPFNTSLGQELRGLRKRYKKLLNSKKREFRLNILTKMEDLRTSNPNQYWKLFEELKGVARNDSPDISPEQWIQHFSEALNGESGEEDTEFIKLARDKIEVDGPGIFNELCFSIREQEIREGIKGLKCGKSSSQDMVLNEMLKAGGEALLPLLMKLFNKAFLSGSFPKLWSQGIIAPIFKKGNRNEPGNYRAVVVSSNLGKLYCTVLNNRLRKFCEVHKLIPDNQIGYRPGFRTSDHILTLKTLIEKSFSRAEKLYCCFVDFKAAFPSVSRPLLLYKLLGAGVGGTFLGAVKAMFDNVELSIRLEGGLSEPFAVNKGVKQGCVLSPLLFNIFTRDLPGFLSECDPAYIKDKAISCLMYADDTILISKSAIGLQRAIDKLYEYCNKWDLIVNKSKTKVMIFNRKGGLVCGNFKYGGETIEIVSDYVYLGINFKPSGSFASACARLKDQARKAMFKIRNVCSDGPVNVALCLFDSLVLPIITYGCEIWGTYFFTRLNDSNFKGICDKFDGEGLAMKFYKGTIGVNKFAANDAVRGDLGRYPILLRSIYLSTKYMEGLVKAEPRSELLGKVVEESRTLKKSWADILGNIFEKFGEGTIQSLDIGRDKNIGENKRRKLSESLHDKMKIRYAQDWRAVINNQAVGGVKGKVKLRTYCNFKDTFALEEYLLSGDIKGRRVLAKLRIGAHKLAIETGRHRRPVMLPEPQRICTACTGHKIENEKHFVMECPASVGHRARLWGDLGEFADTGDWSDGFKFKFIMTGGFGDVEFRHHIFSHLKRIYNLRFA